MTVQDLKNTCIAILSDIDNVSTIKAASKRVRVNIGKISGNAPALRKQLRDLDTKK